MQVLSYRETRRDWFGKKGKSWHVSFAVKKGNDGEIRVEFQLRLGVMQLRSTSRKKKTYN